MVPVWVVQHTFTARVPCVARPANVPSPRASQNRNRPRPIALIAFAQLGSADLPGSPKRKHVQVDAARDLTAKGRPPQSRPLPSRRPSGFLAAHRPIRKFAVRWAVRFRYHFVGGHRTTPRDRRTAATQSLLSRTVWRRRRRRATRRRRGAFSPRDGSAPFRITLRLAACRRAPRSSPGYIDPASCRPMGEEPLTRLQK